MSATFAVTFDSPVTGTSQAWARVPADPSPAERKAQIGRAHV